MVETSSTPQRRDFKMHQALLLSVIKKQAGSLDKAILEAVMNSIDAGATFCHVTIDALKVTIKDDGKGFRDSQEIEDFFETFGTPHEDGDARYGKFRMGRGQMFAFGVNTWRTGQFKMDVDVEKHIGYELLQNLDEAVGCSIEIKLYEPIPQHEVNYIERSIGKMVKYTPIPVYVNGERVNVDIDLKKFPQTTEDAYINTDAKTNGLDIYNLGVFVCTLPTWQYGVSGVVVSRKQLDVNFARNQVLGSCPVWKRIKPLVNAKGESKVTKKLTLSDAEQANVIARLVAGELQSYQATSIRFIKDATGKAWSPSQIQRRKFECYSVADQGDVYADKLMQTGRAFVVARECIELFECREDELFIKHKFHGMPKFVELDKLTVNINASGESLEAKTWTKKEKAWIHVANKMMSQLNGGWTRDENFRYSAKYPSRRMHIGTSQVALAWTDGAEFVTFAREFLATLKMFKNGAPNPSAFFKFGHVLLHELCHDTDSRENVHSPDFYREYHDRSMALADAVGYAMNNMTPAVYKRITGEFDMGEEDSPVEETEIIEEIEPI